MATAKMNFKIKIKAKGTIAVIIIIAFVLAAFLYFALADPPAPQTPIDPAAAEYIGNKSTKKLHLPDCRYVSQISEKNVIYFTSKAEAESFDPCAVCDPK